MTHRDNGGFIGHNPSTTQSGTTAPGIWSLNEAFRRRDNGTWPAYIAPLIFTDTITLTANTLTSFTPGGELTTTNNSTAGYRILEITTPILSQTNTTLYIGLTVKGPQAAYYHDYSIAAAQYYGPNSTFVGSSGNTTGTQLYSIFSGTTTAGASATANPSLLSYTSLNTTPTSSSGTSERWNFHSGGTGSTNTGMANGSNYTAYSTQLPSGGSSITQSTGAPYLYMETSSPVVIGDTIYLRLPMTWNVQDWGNTGTIKIAQYLNTISSNTNSTLIDAGKLYYAQ